MSSSVYVRRFIYSLKQGQTFTTKDVLKFGSRRAVDCTLKRLVEKGQITRLSSGVFRYGAETEPLPSPLEVAAIKAKAYGKKLTMHGDDLAIQCKLALPKPNSNTITFWVDGASSSFRYGNLKIVFQSTSKRKMRLVKKGGAGLSLAALWHIGKTKVTRKEILRSLPTKTHEIEQLKNALTHAPQWLSQFYLKKPY